MELHVLFFQWKSKINKKGLAPIYCRITKDSIRKQFATGIQVPPNNWCSVSCKIKRHSLATEYNCDLSTMRNKLIKIYYGLTMNGESPSAQLIFDHYNGNTKPKTILEVYQIVMNNMRTRTNRPCAPQSLMVINQSRSHLTNYLKSKGIQNLAITDVSVSHVTALHQFMSRKGYKLSTINKAIRNLKLVLNHSVNLDFIKYNPLSSYRLKRSKKEIVFLNQPELERLHSFKPQSLKQERVKDTFLFSCYTGLAYCQMAAS